MNPIVESLNYYLALGTIALQIGTIILFGFYFFKQENPLTQLVRSYGLILLFLLSLASAILTLVYSDVFGFTPCGLCWFERIALYPVVLISGMALWQKGREAADYILGLSLVGAIISLYHHYIQMGGSELISCPESGVSCAKRIIFEFDYITFPLMAFTLFATIMVVALFIRRK